MTNETEAPDLKPCPFCGSENLGKLRRSPFQSEASIMCNDCYSSSASTEKWNIRDYLSDAKDKRIAELEVKLAKAVKLMDLSVELAKWDTTLIDDVILFTTELKGTTK